MEKRNVERFGNWSREQALQLIEEYKKHPALYQTTHPDFTKQHLKFEIYSKICAALKPKKPDVSIRAIRRKIKLINQQLIHERRKMSAWTRRGMPVEKFQSKLWCFKKLGFLLNANYQEDPQVESNINVAEITDYSQEGLEEDNDNFLVEESTARPSVTGNDNDNFEILEFYAKKSSELMVAILQNSEAQQDKAELFCAMLLESLYEIIQPEIYDAVTMEIFQIVRKAKTKERELLERRQLLKEITSKRSTDEVCSSTRLSNAEVDTKLYTNPSNQERSKWVVTVPHSALVEPTVKIETELILECKQEEEEILTS